MFYTLGLRSLSDADTTASTLFSVRIMPYWIFILVGCFYLATRKLQNRNYEIYFFVFCVLYTIVNVLLNRSVHLGTVIMAFIAPVLIGLFIKNISDARYTVYKIVVSYFIFECGLAIVQRILGVNLLLTPSDTGFFDMGVSSNSGFRSASIHGHPLQGALMVSVVMGFIYISDLKLKKKILLLLMGFMALLSFNTRSSIFLWGIILAFMFLQIIFSKKYDVMIKSASLCLFVIGAIGLWVLLQQGWGGRLLEMSLFDEKSAQVRIDVFYMFNFLSLEQLLWGIPSDVVSLIKDKSNINIIENYWIAYIFYFGLICTLVFVTFVVLCLRPLFKGIPTIKILISVGVFLLISSTNNSMITAVPALIVLVLCVYSFPIKKQTLRIKSLTQSKIR